MVGFSYKKEVCYAKEISTSKKFFGEELKLEALKKHTNPLLKLEKPINWDIFRNILEKTFNGEEKDDRGRAYYDYVMMFKILILQTMYQLSDDEMEIQIMDRLSFMSFLGFSLEDKRVPDSKTIWHFRNILSEKKKLNL